MAVAVLAAGFATILFVIFFAFVTRYKRCPSDRILVVYGRTKGEGSAQCYHGGGRLILPVLQGYEFLDLTPITIDIKLQGALSKQNIRINTPSTFTVGISTQPGVMQNAAERLLGLTLSSIESLARDIIFGQMRVVIATMPIEEINADRDQLINNITESLEAELRKVGLRLINVNIQDVTDESGYIDALGKEAAARAINDAKVQVAERERDGNIGAAYADRERRIQVAAANATATEGENEAKVTVANSDADRRQNVAEAERQAVAAERVTQARAAEEAFAAEQTAESARGDRDKASQFADIIVPAEIEKQRIETIAEADAEQIRRLKRGEADGLLAVLQAEADGLYASLNRRAEGFGQLVDQVGGSPEMVALLLVTEQMSDLIAEQVKAISNIKIDQVTVWETGSGGGESGKGSTADFMSGLVGALPPLHELAGNVGINLPKFLGTVDDPDVESIEKLAKAAADLRAAEEAAAHGDDSGA